MNSAFKLTDIIETNLSKVSEQIDPGLFISALLAAIASAFAASLLYRFFYERRGTGSQVHRAFPLLAVSITTLFIGVQISIPLSLGLLGSLSIIRFRTPIKEPEEVGFIMLVVAASISAATFNFMLIVYLYLAAIICLLVMRGTAMLKWMKRDGLLIVTVNHDGAPEKFKKLESFLGKSVDNARLESTSTHAGLTTFQYIFSGLRVNAADLEKGINDLAGAKEVSIFLDRPGGIR